MFLNYLKILRGAEEIRNIPFKKGSNFIVDKTPFKGTESGNNVGKTTILRLIDYCLGSKGKDIFSDPEFPARINTNLKNHLEENNFSVELSIVDFSGDEKVNIQRNFLPGKNKAIIFNGNNVGEDKLKEELNKIIFDNEGNRPSFRFLIQKFIRDTPHKMSRTLKFLYQGATDSKYEAVHLFLFGISLNADLIEEKGWLEKKLKTEKEVIARISEDGNTENALKQALKVINRDIDKLEKEKENFNVGENEKEEIEELNALRFEISSLSNILGIKKAKLQLIKEAINELQGGKSSYDTEVVKEIYEEANLFLPELQKDFEEVIHFHNTMLENKINFISKDFKEISNDVSSLEIKLDAQLNREKYLSGKLNSIFKVSDYDNIIKELNKKYELKGNKEERYTQLSEVNKSLSEKKERLDFINTELNDLEPKLEKNVELFNEFFAGYSKELYEEEFYLTYDKTNGNFKFAVQNIQANVGGGKKKGQIAAFDLAYIEFCNKIGLASPRFVLHDSTEDVSINQLLTINDIANSLDGQYIVAVLNDKFSGNDELEKIIRENKIIELSEKDKLFKFN